MKAALRISVKDYHQPQTREIQPVLIGAFPPRVRTASIRIEGVGDLGKPSPVFGLLQPLLPQKCGGLLEMMLGIRMQKP
jgi:hypothetical protein